MYIQYNIGNSSIRVTLSTLSVCLFIDAAFLVPAVISRLTRNGREWRLRDIDGEGIYSWNNETEEYQTFFAVV